ncbi:MAG: radical SAM protein [Clostridia bacterium]|nr:radical SAM protein [Clostridia bacterium]MBQ8862329.1 radical SAM protein [Clostridia bacterium]
MIITYETGTGLYVNLTNRCSNACDFCVRSYGNTIYGNLWLEREPTVEEIKESIFARDLSAYSEIVFCGYGEPTERLADIREICKAIRERSDIQIRINTNGHSDLINGRDTAQDFEGLFDVVSISLNTSDPAVYKEMCRPKFGGRAHMAIIDFALNVKNYVPRVILSVVDTTVPPEDIEMCRGLAEDIGVEFRLREFI